MKTITIKLFLILTMLFTFSACEIMDEIDDNTSGCFAKENQLAIPKDQNFALSCRVHWKDGSPAKSLSVIYQTKKEYCDGTIKGVYVIDDPKNLTDVNGFFDPKWTSTYTYNNKKDRVLVKFTIGSYEYEYVYRWEDLPNYSWVSDSIHITLPQNEDGSS